MANSGRTARWLNAVRVVAIVVLFAWSLLVIFPAGKMPLFYLTLGATEYGHWLAVVALVLAGPRRKIRAMVPAFAALLAAGLFISSAVRAAMLSQTLPTAFKRAFSMKVEAPFSWSRLWTVGKVPSAKVETFTFAERDAVALKLDLYRPVSVGSAPCVIMVHGGGWVNGIRSEFPDLNHFLATRGVAVAAVDYRLAPGSRWPAQRDDVCDAIDYLRAHAAELGIDASRIVLMGRSAGGQIAEVVAYTKADSVIRGCIALYSPADMNFAFQYADPNDILNSLQLLQDYLGGTPDQARQNYDSASGIVDVNRKTVPTMLVHGRRDTLVWFRQSERLSESLTEAGVPHLFVQMPWATHAFDYNIHGPGGQIATWAIENFVQAVTGGSDAAPADSQAGR